MDVDYSPFPFSFLMTSSNLGANVVNFSEDSFNDLQQGRFYTVL